MVFFVIKGKNVIKTYGCFKLLSWLLVSREKNLMKLEHLCPSFQIYDVLVRNEKLHLFPSCLIQKILSKFLVQCLTENLKISMSDRNRYQNIKDIYTIHWYK